MTNNQPGISDHTESVCDFGDSPCQGVPDSLLLNAQKAPRTHWKISLNIYANTRTSIYWIEETRYPSCKSE
jgi:hypothetical protein